MDPCKKQDVRFVNIQINHRLMVCVCPHFSGANNLLRLYWQYVVPKTIHTSLKERTFSKTSHPSDSNKALHISLNLWVLQNPPPPRKFQSLMWGEYGYLLDVPNRLKLLIDIMRLTNSNL